MGFALALAALTLFRLLYYGSPVPNTFYAKVGGVPRAMAVQSLWSYLAFGYLGLLPAALLAVRRRAAWPGLVFCVLTFGYVVAVGAGGGPSSRFLLPSLPVASALAVWGAGIALAERPAGWPLVVASLPATVLWYWIGAGFGLAIFLLAALVALGLELRGRRRPGALAATALAGALAALLGLGVPWSIEDARPEGLIQRTAELSGRRTFDRHMHRYNRKVALRLVSELGDDQLLAAGAIGSLGFYSRYRIIDYFGLVDPHVARSDERPEGDVLLGFGHQRSHAAYVLGRRPDLIFMPAPGQPLLLPAHVGIARHPDFDRLYTWDEDLGVYRRVEGGAASASAR